MKNFNVLLYDFNSKKVEHYDVLPYFRRNWNDKKLDNFQKSKVKSKSDLKNWIERASSYTYWARCEYEFLIASWPFGSYRMNQDLKEFLTPEFNIDDYESRIKIQNIIIRDMDKIDVHSQIMMNIDIITDILYKEFEEDVIKNQET